VNRGAGTAIRAHDNGSIAPAVTAAGPLWVTQAAAGAVMARRPRLGATGGRMVQEEPNQAAAYLRLGAPMQTFERQGRPEAQALRAGRVGMAIPEGYQEDISRALSRCRGDDRRAGWD